ncbi:MAG: VacJ family lipoprotein [Magnetococcales bacterium]|nr:VacJ family lipoprotein [Magnetococcales bacterium]
MSMLVSIPILSGVSDSWAHGHNTEQMMTTGQDEGLSSGDESMEEMSENVSDPLEGWNRFMFGLNDLIYFGIIRPISRVYAALAPEGLRIAVRNFFHNLEMPRHFISALFQGDIRGAGREIGRFGINTVLGLGFFDVAKDQFDMESGDEDIGQVLGNMGVGDSLYLVWPLVGPSNLRDTVGLVGDTLLSPLTYYPKDDWARVAVHSFRTINNTSLRIGEYEDLKEAALDPYISLRDAYLKMRQKKISE